jgi:lysophospholipase L1-like esterase
MTRFLCNLFTDSMNSARNQPGQLRRIVTGTTLFLLSMLLVFLLLEIGLRIFAANFFPRMMVLDDKLGWRHAASVRKTFVNEDGERILVVHNAYGYRGKVYDLRRTPGSLRVLALGDSFTEGAQVGEEELFTSKLESADPRLEVINTGVGGYGTIQEYLYLISEGLQFHPDLVLLMVFENDFTDNNLSYYPGFGPRPYAKLSGRNVQIIEKLDSSGYERFILPFPFRMELSKHSFLYYFATTRVYQPFLAQRMREMERADLRRIDSNTRYKVFYSVLDRLNDRLKEGGIPLLVVLIPSREEVIGGRSQTESAVIMNCESQGIRCVSLLSRFAAETNAGQHLYFQSDIHWTKTGHRVAAGEILQHILHILRSPSAAPEKQAPQLPVRH